MTATKSLAIVAWSRTSLSSLRALIERARTRHVFAILEIIAVVAIAILIARFFYQNGGQLVGSDMLGYINIGFRRGLSTHMLNRYVHIYTLRTLTSVFPSPLEALRYFSAIAAGLAALLAYYSARSMSKTPQIMRGIIAVAILLGLPVVVQLLLAPQIDTSAMIAVLALTAIYVRSAKDNHRNPWVIRLLGLVLFLAFKTKETTVVWSVTLIGFAITDRFEFNTRKLATNLWILLQGVVAGVIVFAIANWFFLGEPLFGLRPSDFLGFSAIWDEVAVQRLDPLNILTSIVLPQAAIAFILFIAAGLWGRSRTTLALQPLWLVPLVLLVLLTVTVNRITAGISPRHFLPGFALMAVLGSQVVGSRLPQRADRRKAIWLFLGTVVLIGIVVLIGLSLRPTWIFPRYFEAILAPITLAVAFGLILTFAHRRRIVELPVLLCLLVLTIYPIRVKYPEIAMQNTRILPNARFYAVQVFEAKFLNLENSETFVASSLLPHLFINDDPNELRALFNVALNARTEQDNFDIGVVDAELIESLELGKFDYLLISSDAWDWMRTTPQDRPEWRDQYSGTLEPSGQFVLVVKSEPD